MKKISIFLLRFYKKRISPIFSFMGIHCKYYPTCSAYALKAFEKHGAVKGLILTVWRILRCNPFSLGGVDHVPDEFYLYTLKSRQIKENINSEDKV